MKKLIPVFSFLLLTLTVSSQNTYKISTDPKNAQVLIFQGLVSKSDLKQEKVKFKITKIEDNLVPKFNIKTFKNLASILEKRHSNVSSNNKIGKNNKLKSKKHLLIIKLS